MKRTDQIEPLTSSAQPHGNVWFVRFYLGSFKRQKEIHDYMKHLDSVDKLNRQALGVK